MKTFTLFVVTVMAVLTLASCLGVQADISIRADGSGRIVLEYRVSQLLEAMGRLDGNERWPAIPVGREDFQRSVARIPGLRLLSFRTSEAQGAFGGPATGSPAIGRRDLVTRAELEFADIAVLVAFMDSTGNRASFTQNSGRNVLRLTLLEPSAGIANADLLSLLKEISAGYEIGIDLSAPNNASLSVIPPSVRAARLVSAGRRVSFAIGLGDLLHLNELALEIAW
jgi:hypothetical protein